MELSTDATDATVDPAIALRSALDDLIEAAEVFGQACRHADQTELDDAARILKSLREDVVEPLRKLDAGIFVRHIARLLRHASAPVEIEGLGAVEVRRSTNRRAWQHSEIVRSWINATMISTGGEVPDPWDMIDRFRKFASIGGYKVGAAKELGLDVNDYCDTEPGPSSVSFL